MNRTEEKRRWNHSPAGQSAKRRYRLSQKGRATRLRYDLSHRGRLTKQAERERALRMRRLSASCHRWLETHQGATVGDFLATLKKEEK